MAESVCARLTNEHQALLESSTRRAGQKGTAAEPDRNWARACLPGTLVDCCRTERKSGDKRVPVDRLPVVGQLQLGRGQFALQSLAQGPTKLPARRRLSKSRERRNPAEPANAVPWDVLRIHWAVIGQSKFSNSRRRNDWSHCCSRHQSSRGDRRCRIRRESVCTVRGIRLPHRSDRTHESARGQSAHGHRLMESITAELSVQTAEDVANRKCLCRCLHNTGIEAGDIQHRAERLLEGLDRAAVPILSSLQRRSPERRRGGGALLNPSTFARARSAPS
jgi:hypothetical protein